MNKMNRTIFGLALIILAPLLTGTKPSARPEQPTEPIPGVEAMHDERAKATFYYPIFNQWPQPEVMIYPAIAKSDGGSRTMVLRMAVKDVWMRSMDLFALRVDGDSVNVPLNEKDAVTFDASGCRSVTKVNLGQQEALVRKIATGRQVEVSFGKSTTMHYQLDRDDLDRFKRMVALFDTKELPPVKA